MAVTDIRQRSGFLFLGVVVAHVLLISAQVNSRTGVPVLEAVTFGIFSEVQRTLSGGVGGVRQVWGNYVGLRHVKAENDDLKRQLAAAEIALQEQRALADRARGLQKLLELLRLDKLLQQLPFRLGSERFGVHKILSHLLTDPVLFRVACDVPVSEGCAISARLCQPVERAGHRTS